MSSDSELDEFFDAEDVTPNKSVLEPLTETHGIVDEDLDEEEQELLRLRRLQEERRKKEDEELQKRLQLLKAKKREEKEKKLEQEKKEHHERRRRKHEELRRKITEKGDNSHDSTSSSAESDNTESDMEDSLDNSPDRLTSAEKTLNNTPPTCVSLPVTVTSHTSIPEHIDKYGEMSININSSQPVKEKPNKQMYKFVSDKQNKVDTIDHNLIDVENVVETVLQETRLLNTDNEPDIVMSTKTRTPPNTLQKNTVPVSVPTIIEPPIDELCSSTFKEPVAPPRRKKKLKVCCTDQHSLSARSSVSSISADGPLDVDPQSPGLPVEYSLNPEAELENLTDDLEHSLDLRSIIKGKKHIKAQDAEMNAINIDQDSMQQTVESMSGSSKSSSLRRRSSDSKLRTSSSLDRRLGKTASLEREGKKSKTTSLESRASKSGSLEKEGRRRSRQYSSQDGVGRRESMNRPRSSSGKPLTDEEILESFMVKNLDTGETVPLKDAEVKLQKCVDPLVLHIMERTNNYPSEESSSDKDFDTKSEGGQSKYTERALKKKGKKLMKLFGKTVSKVKAVKDQMMHGEDNVSVVEEGISDDGRRFKFKANHNKKGPYEFGQLQFVQDLSGEHTGAVWVMKFSPCGRLLATGGQDSALRIWVLDSAFSFFDDMRQKYVEVKVSPAPSQESLSSHPSSSSDLLELGATADSEEEKRGPFKTKPFCKYRGHTADVLDISWSKNYFILSSSMDKTVRLWHISRRECLCTFQHIDFVTAIVFHPKDDRYFLSGSLDGKLRLWNIPDKKVTLWNEVGSGSLITTANFCHNGKFAVVGTYDGKCIFYSTEHLKYYTQIHVRSTRGKNSRGRKITSIEPLPGEDKVLVTSNDSRVRLYDLRDLTLTCKYKGHSNTSSQIRASFSPRGKYVISGSEDHFVYLWKTQHEFYKFSSARRDRNDYYEAVKAHNAVVTSAVFAPNPSHFENSEDSACKKTKDSKDKETSSESEAEYLVSADFLGCIKIIKAK